MKTLYRMETLRQIGIFLPIMLVWLCVGCEQPNNQSQGDDEEPDVDCFDTYLPSYVYSYHIADSMYVESIEPHQITILFSSTECSTPTFESELHDSLSIKHNDTDYDSWIRCHYMPFFPHNYLAADLVSIQIVSDADFNAQHTAGTPLNDIVQFSAYTPLPFIQSGYAGKTEAYYLARLEYEITHIEKPLSQCTQADFILILGQKSNDIIYEIPCCVLTFLETPTLAQQHTIRVTVLDDAGKTWQASIDMEWSEA